MSATLIDEALLPVNATPFEIALSGTTKRLLDIPAPHRDLWRWDTCPASHLPWLAWAMSVDVWDETWSEARKREIIRESFTLHRLKGTLEGIRRHLLYVDVKIARAITPPQDVYWAPFDQANIDNWEATLPQIRIYPRREPGTADGFYFSDYYDDDGEVPGAYYEENRAQEDGGFRKVFYDPADETETEIDWIGEVHPTYGTYTELGLPGFAKPDHFYFDADFYDDAVMVSERDGASNVVAMPPLAPQEIRDGWYRVTNVTADYVNQTGEAGDGHLYMGDGTLDDGPDNDLDGDYYAGNEAPFEVYRRWHIFSPDTSDGDPDGWSYYDDMRYGMPPYTAHLWLDIPETSPILESYDDLDHFYRDTDLTRFHQALDTIVFSKSLRDQILVDTEIKTPVTFAHRKRFDSFNFGQYVDRIY